MITFIGSILISLITIFVVMDPFPSILPFLDITHKESREVCIKCALKIVGLAGILAFFFLFTGNSILSALNIGINDFKVAGGIVLGLLGIETVLGIEFWKGSKKHENKDSALLLIATPLLTGPGLITSLIVLQTQFNFTVVAIALSIALILTAILLILSLDLKKVLGEKGLMVLSKIIGLILIAIAVSYLRTGILS
ncbi:MAG: MarC family protein [Candidatus Diapherotrites archaeon]|nr:MarC family protein [Candidatus Diapherotrites archaeon]